ncbi:MAG: ribonuclease E activity regulator RraA [SAR324 cluster bacterium]|nr:ribonuclease E activity regulator RraA [SAR324 cluster bacterium]
MSFKTADLCDEFSDQLQIASPGLTDFGGLTKFCGQIVTLKLFEDNSLVREAVATEGNGRVLVVDGGGSLRCAVLGDLLAEKAVKNGWSGLVINGCVRDSADIAGMKLGVKALASHPLKTEKRGLGDKNVVVNFCGVTFRPGEYLYADEDGIIVSATPCIV